MVIILLKKTQQGKVVMTLGSFRVLINQSEVYGSGDVVLLFAIGTFKIKEYKIKQRRLAPQLNYQ